MALLPEEDDVKRRRTIQASKRARSLRYVRHLHPKPTFPEWEYLFGSIVPFSEEALGTDF